MNTQGWKWSVVGMSLLVSLLPGGFGFAGQMRDTRGEGLFRDTLAWIRVGLGVSYKNMTFFPLLLKGPSKHHGLGKITTLDEALEAGTLVIRETRRGEVAMLLVENRGKRPVLLLAGEILVGGKQNRTLQQDVLLPPRSGEILLPAYCVEQGRWQKRTNTFYSEGTLAHPGLRKKALKKAPQAMIWEEVRARSREAEVASPTGDVQAVYGNPKVAAKVDKGMRVLERQPGWDARTMGVVVVKGGRIVGMDLFGLPSLFEKVRHKVMRTYLMEAGPGFGKRFLHVGKERIEDFLHGLKTRTLEPVPSVGVGRLFRIEGEGGGSVLIFRSGVVHAAVLL